MPYQYSGARKQYIADIAAISITLKESFSPKCTSKRVKDYALCSAVILTSAKLETYFETLVSDWCRAILANGVLTDALPLNTRAFLLNHTSIEIAYKKLIFRQDESEFLPEIGRLIGTSVFQFANSGQPVPAFQLSRVYSESKYPSPKNVKRLFRRCGIDPVFPKLNAIAKRDVESLLTSFNDIRTELAHAGMPPGLSAGDIRARIAEATSTVGYIDRLFYSHVLKTTGATCWTP
jgi:hypothetical protein